ncbi:MAG: hypothetical protein CR982_07105 [Candidatus Cloacimonadota bacterium]|nr:MAG: hypothetical protein CR982_07105 [Candidatus Cloacimonadota bacterium]PIE80634.1 MAG: hypothetical protein CSA15_01660 [Candidatus Delongbacteria bacterium]
MDNIINSITSSNLNMIIAGVLIVLILYFVLKKLLKLALIVSLITLGYFAYLYFTGEDLPFSKDEIKEKIEDFKDNATEKLEEVVKDGKKVKKNLENKLEGN